VVTKATNSPTVVPPLRPWAMAIMITTDKPQAARICVTGVIVPPATTALSMRRRTLSARLRKRWRWCSWAPKRRTMRQASMFSSTT